MLRLPYEMIQEPPPLGHRFLKICPLTVNGNKALVVRCGLAAGPDHKSLLKSAVDWIQAVPFASGIIPQPQ